MTIGFIGTGAIAEAMIDGLCGVAGLTQPIVITTRSEARSARLAARYDNVTRADDPQTIVDGAETVVIAVLPPQASEVLSSLTFKAETRVLSLVAGLSLADLGQMVAPATDLQLAIPLPPIDRGLGPIPLCPEDGPGTDLLGGVGTLVRVADERQFQALSAGSALMAMSFALMARTATWLEGRDLAPENAALYATSMTEALATMAGDHDAEIPPPAASPTSRCTRRSAS